MSTRTTYPEDGDPENFGPPDPLSAQERCLLYSAAKTGHSITAVYLLNNIKDEQIRNEYVNQIFEEEDGQEMTLLTAAAINGRHLVVKTLLTRYKIDLEKQCTVKFGGHMIYGATALWCAAGEGFLNIVKLLIAHGANVNHKTKSHSTPLRAACFDGRLNIVRYLILHGADVHLANTYNNTCLMISAYKGHDDVVEFMLETGANPNAQALCEATALHYAAECGHVDVCNKLLDYGATLKRNEYGLTPLMTAAEKTHENVVALFCNRPGLLSKIEKINAYELMGASFANDKDNYDVEKAYKHLLTAMQLRYEDESDIIKKKLYPPVPAYDNWAESQTLQELRAIRLNHNSIHMESLAIRERILGRKYPDLVQPVVFRGAIFADQRIFDRCESLWLYALSLRQNNRISVQRDLLRFAQLFSQMIHTNLPVHLSSVLTVLSSCIFELQQNRMKIKTPGPKDDVCTIAEEFEQNVMTALYMLTLTTKVMKSRSHKFQIDELATLYKFVYSLNKMDVRLRDGQTLLHLAVNGVTPVDDFHTNDVCRFPCLDTVLLLLHCGANVCATDCDRNTPLHTLTSTFQTSRANTELFTVAEKIIETFLKAGIHFDAVNKDGLTAKQVSRSTIIESIVKQHEMGLTSLKCLASRCIARHKINYVGFVPKQLEDFVKIHSAAKS